MLAEKQKTVCDQVQHDNAELFSVVNIPSETSNIFFFQSCRIRDPGRVATCATCAPYGSPVGGTSSSPRRARGCFAAVLQLATAHRTVASLLLGKKKKERADITLSAFLLPKLENQLKILSCHAGKMSLFYFCEDTALRWVKYGEAGFCIQELALATPKLQLANYLWVVWKRRVASSAPRSVITGRWCHPEQLHADVDRQRWGRQRRKSWSEIKEILLLVTSLRLTNDGLLIWERETLTKGTITRSVLNVLHLTVCIWICRCIYKTHILP